VQWLRKREDIALQQFEFYTQLIACQVIYSEVWHWFDVLHKIYSNQGVGLPLVQTRPGLVE
jgi:hypothetical protein